MTMPTITDEDRETLKLAWSVIDYALQTVPGFDKKLPMADWVRISMVLGRLACPPQTLEEQLLSASHVARLMKDL